MIKALYQFRQLSDDLKASNKVRGKSRIDCLLYTDLVSGGYQGLSDFTNKKGQLALYKTPCKSFVNANHKRVTEWSLTNNSINLSSIYIDDLEHPNLAYGYPNPNRYIGRGKAKENPLYPFRNDAYLFILNQDISVLDILIIPDGRNHINTYYQLLIDGNLDDEITELKRQAKPYFKYIGL
jgi:hypothetical protein